MSDDRLFDFADRMTVTLTLTDHGWTVVAFSSASAGEERRPLMEARYDHLATQEAVQVVTEELISQLGLAAVER